MDGKAIAVLATAVAGGFVAMQAPINSGLGKTIGSLPAATVSFLVGFLALAGITFISGEGFGRLGEIAGIPWYYLLGGVLGAVYVTTVLIAIRTLGAGGATAATIGGQLAASMVLDRLGVLGLEQREFTPTRLAGVALLAAGVLLVVRS
ncbi:MAG: bacterial/archaeal transporter family-2 protein [Thermoleophilaceae bacterium]|jgi:transporter family-2 protein|nr:bacterial/archaeal transporter family-2 protein [Thermoleophilaceae bacterium]MEA2454754.1 bacterial/archaeal transporter family-2 protein [Thermoleophilaceae bacterium]